MAGEAIFIGYRRDDTADVAGRIHDAFAARFGQRRIFMDVDNLRPGADFGEYIKTVLPSCRVALILIGPNWVDVRDERGERRLDDPRDWVRVEIETALATPGLIVTPVLVNGAQMPRAEDLPESLRPLLQRHAAIIRRNPDFRDDVRRLINALRASVKSGFLDFPGSPKAKKHTHLRWRPAATLVAVSLALAAAWTFWALREEATAWRIAEQQDSIRAYDEYLESHPFGPHAGDARQSRTRLMAELEQVRERARERRRAFDEGRPFSYGEGPEIVRIQGQSFAAGIYEVTFEEWDACVAAGGCNGYRPDDEGWGRGRRPVINVSWNDAQAYVQWLSQRTGQRFRLLTSAEWEMAARAGTTTSFFWGDQDPVCDPNARNGANFTACTDDRTRPVGSFQPSAFGLYDVHGNVSEWVQDCSDPSCTRRVLRSASWGNTADNLRAASGGQNDANARNAYYGFRVAWDRLRS